MYGIKRLISDLLFGVFKKIETFVYRIKFTHTLFKRAEQDKSLFTLWMRKPKSIVADGFVYRKLSSRVRVGERQRETSLSRAPVSF